MRRTRTLGFSLVELLITLAIMGVIATFAVPPLFQVPASRSNTKYTAIARDAAFMVLTAYEQYRAAHSSVASNTTFGALTPYMSYVRTDNTTTIDYYNSNTTLNCSSYTCLKLHNGAMILYNPTWSFNGTNTTNANFFFLDPDGIQTDATTNGPGKSVCIWLQYDGTLHTWGTLPATINTTNGVGSASNFSATPTYDPIWFQGF